MSTVYSVTLEKIMKDLSLTPMYMPDEPSNILISNNNISRPGLQLTGYFDFFDKTRILVFGNTEFTFLSRFGAEQQQHVINSIFRFGPPAVILCRSYELVINGAECEPYLTGDHREMLENADRIFEGIEHIRKNLGIKNVYIGIEKNKPDAIELMKRGHRLIADDAVEIRKTDSRTLIGSSPQNIRHFVELRGVGIINARNLFGMGSIKLSEKIDMVINLELWDGKKAYDRMGLENEYMEILGIDVPIMTIPVKPGRNLSNIIEVAAMNNRQKKMGYNAAQDLLTSLGMVIDEELVEKRVVDNWDK